MRKAMREASSGTQGPKGALLTALVEGCGCGHVARGGRWEGGVGQRSRRLKNFRMVQRKKSAVGRMSPKKVLIPTHETGQK